MSVLLKRNDKFSIYDVDQEIHRRLAQAETDSFIYIVPTKRKLRDVQREFLSKTPDGAASAFHLFTLETLAVYLHSIICRPKKFTTAPVQAVLLNEAIRSIYDQLRYFKVRQKPFGLPKGTFQKILDTINYLKEKGAYPSLLRGELNDEDAAEKWKLKDILTIYEAYEEMLGDKFTDIGGIFKELNLNWQGLSCGEIFKTHFGNVNTVFVSGFDEFSNPELSMLYNLSSLDWLTTIVLFDYHLANDELFGHLKENYNKFNEMGFTREFSKRNESQNFDIHIKQNLFKFSVSPEVVNMAEKVTLIAAPDRHKEVEVIAKLIKKLVKEKPDCDLNKICVSMFQPGIYTGIIREAFNRYGIPANITDRYELNQSPLIVSLIALLTVKQNNFRVEDIMRALSSPYFDFSNSGIPINAANLYSVATKLKVSAGYSKWLSRIEQELKVISEEITTNESEKEDFRLKNELHALTAAKNDLKYLWNLLKPFEGNLKPLVFKERLLNLIVALHLVETVLKVQNTDMADILLEMDTRAYQKFTNFLEEFLNILAMEGKDDTPEPLSYYLDRLKTAIHQVRYNIKQKYGYGVYVTSFEETRGLKFDVMIIIGLIDGEFPSPYKTDIFIGPGLRARKERYHLTEQRYLFYQASTNFNEHLFLTYPRKDKELELVPSFFIDAILKIIEVEDWRIELPGYLTDGIYSEDELLGSIGKSYWNSIETNNPPALPNINRRIDSQIKYLQHAIDVEYSRVSNKLLPAYDGVMSDNLSPSAKYRLNKLRKLVYSVSQLEMYGKCPFQYFAERILNLNVISEIEEFFSPLERGDFLHDLLFEFYVNRRERNLPQLSEVTDEQFRQALDELVVLAKQKLDKYFISDIFWDIDKEILFGTENRKGLLSDFLEKEREQKLNVAPSYFEVAFGAKIDSKQRKDPDLYYEKPVWVGDVQLQGKIDRIDIGDKYFTVIDYKSSTTVPNRKEIETGFSLQLPVYLYAFEHIFSERLGKNLHGAAGLYYLLKPPVKKQLGIGNDEYNGKAFIANKRSQQLVADNQELKEVIDKTLAFVNDYVEKISSGLFPVQPKIPEQVCEYCNFQRICRVQTIWDVQKEEDS